MSLNNYSIKLQITLVVGILFSLLGITGVAGLMGMSASVDINKQLTEESMPKTVASNSTLIWIARQRTSLDQAAMTTDPAWAKQQYKNENDSRQHALESWSNYEALPQSAEGKKLVTKVSEGIQKVESDITAMRKAIEGGDRQEISTAAKTVGSSYTAMQGDGMALSKYEEQHANENLEHARNKFGRAKVIAIASISIGALLSLYSWISLRKAIAAPLSRILSHFSAISNGDLTQHVHVNSKNEMGQLLKGLDSMQNSLSETVATVRTGSDQISIAAREISIGNQDLAQRTELQAASVEETVSSIEQLSAAVQNNAENAKEASSLASNARDIALGGNAAVGEMVETMASIRESSIRIQDIVSLIDGIAFQTNILALNAAVEAARAGEQGRGFAVVASEVRALATRSAEAAKEIKQLIMLSVERISTGSSLAGKAGETMNSVIDSVKQVAEIIGSISLASNEQSSGVAQVLKAITEIDDATQQNSALVEQINAAASALGTQADNLRDEASRFKVNRAATFELIPA